MVLGEKLGLRIDTHHEVMVDRIIQVQLEVKVDFKLMIIATVTAVVVLVGSDLWLAHLDIKEPNLGTCITYVLSKLTTSLSIGAIQRRQINDWDVVTVCCLRGIHFVICHR